MDLKRTPSRNNHMHFPLVLNSLPPQLKDVCVRVCVSRVFPARCVYERLVALSVNLCHTRFKTCFIQVSLPRVCKVKRALLNSVPKVC